MGEAALVADPVAPASRAPSPVIVQGLGKRYTRTWAVRGVDFDARRGEICGLIGPDGAGKSTLLKAVAGVLTYNAGTVDVFGIRVDSERSAERVKDRIGFMPQGLGLNLYPELSVEENIDFFAQLRLVPAVALAARKRQLLAMAHLEPFRQRVVKHLSGGMKQKLGLICTLIHEPQLLILDEPTTGVDPVSRRDFWHLLAQLVQEREMTAVISTAYMDEAARFDRIVLMHDGVVIARGEPDAVLALAPEVAGAEQSAHQLEAVFLALIERQTPQTPQTSPPRSPPALLRQSPRRDGDIVLEAKELVRDFGEFRAVDRVTFQVSAGEIVGLLGANGAGKTTVIKMLTGILPPSAGMGRVAGADMRHAGRRIRERIGYMSQAFSLYRDLTVIENIHLYAGIYGLDRRAAAERAAWLIQMAGLAGQERVLAGDLPLGLRQRLALGCALVHRPQVLFLDEPTSGVDPAGRRRFWEILCHLSREDGVAILLTTHYMTEAERCDRVALMSAGRLVADAAPETLKRETERETGMLIDVSTDAPARALDVLTHAGFAGVTLVGKRLHLLSSGEFQGIRTRIVTRLTAAGIAVRSIVQQPLSMEEVFIARVTALERAAVASSANPETRASAETHAGTYAGTRG